MVKSYRLIKIRPEEYDYMINMKNKQGLKSLADSAKNMRQFIEGTKKKKKIKEKIIREIEF